jgi:hypothetical protein
MALARALVDRARRVYEQQAPQNWTEEGPPMVEKHGPWFRCRLTEHQPSEQVPSGRGVYTFLEGDAELLFGTTDLEGGSLRSPDGEFEGFDVDDQVQVESADLGTRLWQVHTGAEPIRKRRRVIGYRVGLRRVEDVRVDR